MAATVPSENSPSPRREDGRASSAGEVSASCSGWKMRAAGVLAALVLCTAFAACSFVPELPSVAFLWSVGPAVFPGKDVRVSHAVSASDVYGVVKQLTLPEAECGASGRGEAFAVDCASRPEAVVVFLFPELRADHVSQWGGAYAVNSARSGAFGNLRNAVEETASASVTASLVYMQGGASLAAQMAELAQQLGASRVVRVGSADQLATLLSADDSERFADGMTDLVLVDLPTPYGRSSAMRADSEMAQVSALMDLATASRVAFVAAAGGSASLAEHASRASLVGESYSYFPPSFWEPFMVMLFIGFVWLVGVQANLAVQSPSRFFSAKSGKRGALSAER